MANIKSAIVAQKLLDNGVEIGEGISVELPGLEQETTDIKGAGILGTIAMPATGQFADAETTINLNGIGPGGAALCARGSHRIEVRNAQDYFDKVAGTNNTEQVKIFMSTVFKSSEGTTIENGSPAEGSVVHTVLRYEEYVDGKETKLWDKVAMIYRINGVDQLADVRAMLN